MVCDTRRTSDAAVIPKERIEQAREKWRGDLIGKFLGTRMDSGFIGKALAHKWRIMCDLEIIPTLYGFMIFRFTNEEDKQRAQTRGTLGGWRRRARPRGLEAELQAAEREDHKGSRVVENAEAVAGVLGARNCLSNCH